MAIVIDNSRMIFKTTKVTFLEMHQPPAEQFTVKESIRFQLLKKPIQADQYRRFYYGVGEKFFWLDRMVMPDDELFQKINAANVDIFVMYADEQPAGFAEFFKEKDYTEIVYFGLLPSFIGKGLGKYFLQWAIQRAWSYKPKWIQVNTCELDHPNALPVYKKIGFQPVKTSTEQRCFLASIPACNY